MSEISAYHEAGHAFMAIYVGARVRSVTIEPDDRYAKPSSSSLLPSDVVSCRCPDHPSLPPRGRQILTLVPRQLPEVGHLLDS